MSKERIEQIEKRINWLSVELIHEGYLEGVVIEGYKKEIQTLQEELKKLTK